MNQRIKLLIIAGTPGLLSVGNKYNGGGWIATLQSNLIKKYKETLDIALIHFNEAFADTTKDGCRYYCIPLPKRQIVNASKKEKHYKQQLFNIVELENPDVILCFGTEMPFALIQEMTTIPVVVHIQGLLMPISEFILPHAMSWRNYLMNVNRFYTHIIWKLNAEREKRILSSVKYVLGRTEWDKKILQLLSPQADYYYCGEMLRTSIYESTKVWKYKNREKKNIVSVISSPFYKGVDVILRCARILKMYLGYEFTWKVYGISQAEKMVKFTKINPKDVNVQFCGVINEEQLIDFVCDSDVFVHPSYIENSPNTVCEAQILGIPVIATDVGGTSSIISHKSTGILVPSNDIYLMAANIKALITDSEFSSQLGAMGRAVALERHNPDKIAEGLMKIFSEII